MEFPQIAEPPKMMSLDSDIEAQVEVHRSAIEDLNKAYELAVHARLHDIALQLRTQNWRRPVAKLLPELLAEIFYQYVVAVWHAEEPNACFKLSHVCHYWRAVVMQLPTLWRYTTFPMAQLVPTMLARSQQVPIKMKVSRMNTSMDLARFEEALKENSYRIHDLEMRLTCEEFESVASLKLVSAVHLRKLHLTATDQADSNDQLALPSLFENLDHPLQLERLTLDGFHKPWSSVVFSPTLQHLSLTKPFEAAEGIDDLNLLMGALSNLPLLQTLFLNNALPRLFVRQIEGPHAVRPVTFPSLTRLVVEDDILELGEFLANVTIPSSAGMKVGFEGKEVYWKGLSNLAISLHKHIMPNDDRCSSLTSFIIRTVPAKDDKLHIWLDGYDAIIDMSSPDLRVPAEPRITLGPVRLSKSVSMEDVFGDFFAGLPLTHIHHLSIDDLPDMGGSDVLWDRVASSLPNLQTLRVRGKSCIVLPKLIALQTSASKPEPEMKDLEGTSSQQPPVAITPSPSPSAEQAPLLLPRLRSLVLYCDDSQLGSDLRQELCRSFASRRLHFSPSNEISFVNFTWLKRGEPSLSNEGRELLKAIEGMCFQDGRYSGLPSDPDVTMKDESGGFTTDMSIQDAIQVLSYDFSRL